MSTKVLTPKFRVAYAHVFTPQLVTNMDGTPKMDAKTGKQATEYSLVALFPKGADLSDLKAAAQEALVKKFGADKTKWPKNLKHPFRDQGEKEKDGVLPSGYESGAIFMTLKTQEQPGLVDASNQDIIDSTEFYSGCYARATINASAYDKNGGRGVTFYLNNIQKLADGDPLGSVRVKASDEFEPVAVEGAAKASNAEALFD
jgi:hypothetical protein